jgi:cysteine desulfurase
VAAATPGTIVACLMAANHETGAVMPVPTVAAALRARGVVTVTDAALAPGLLDVGAEALGADLIAFSGHKIGGPRGIGALFVRRKTRLTPLQRGGVQEDRVRGGTENVAGAAGFAAALDHAVRTRAERVPRLTALRRRLVEGLLAIPGTSLVGPTEGGLPSTTNVAFDGCEGEALLMNLDLEGVAVSTGSACAVGGTEASPVLLAMGFSARRAASTLRFSVRDGVGDDDVERVRAVVTGVVARLRSMAR